MVSDSVFVFEVGCCFLSNYTKTLLMQSLFKTEKDAHFSVRLTRRTSKNETVCIVRLVAIHIKCLKVQSSFFHVVICSISPDP